MSNDERITTDEAKQLLVLLGRFKRVCETGLKEHGSNLMAVSEFSRAIVSCNLILELASEWIAMDAQGVAMEKKT